MSFERAPDVCRSRDLVSLQENPDAGQRAFAMGWPGTSQALKSPHPCSAEASTIAGIANTLNGMYLPS
jgi:hypothetical protein